MIIEQRKTIPEVPEEATGLWVPGPPPGSAPGDSSGPEPAVPAPRTSDRYVTVDERVEGVVGVVAAEWPGVDSGGLRFSGAVEAAWFGQAELQAVIDRFRGDAEQLTRPLRIGDSFWVRGYDPESVDEWEAVRDVTSQARAMAKAVVAVVAVGALDETPYLAERDFVEEVIGDQQERARRDEPPPSGSETAIPVV